MKERTARRIRRTSIKVAPGAMLAAVAFVAAGCQAGYPHACDNHGGTRHVVKDVNVCKDGHKVGDGWLKLHGKTVAP